MRKITLLFICITALVMAQEIDYTFSSPNPLPSEENLENTGFISFSVGYLIGL